MPTQNNPMSLKAANPLTSTFTPYQYEYKPGDFSILERSLGRVEARQQEASKEMNTLNTTLSGVEKSLNNAEQSWFKEYKQNIAKDMQDRRDIGDYGSLLNYAITKPGEILSDSRILGRINAQEKYTAFQKDLQDKRNKGELSDDDFNYLRTTNKYKYEDKMIGGQYVQGDEWKASKTPVKSFNLAEIATAAFKLISPDKKSSSHSWDNASNLDKDRNITKISEQHGGSSGSTREKVKLQDIREQIDTLIRTLPDGIASVEQAYDAYLWKLNKMQEELANMQEGTDEYNNQLSKIFERKKLMYDNPMDDDTEVSYKEFFARLIAQDLISNKLAYDWTSTESSNKNSTIGSTSRTRGNRGNGNYTYSQNDFNSDDEFRRGNPIEYNDATNNPVVIATGAGNRMVEHVRRSK